MKTLIIFALSLGLSSVALSKTPVNEDEGNTAVEEVQPQQTPQPANGVGEGVARKYFDKNQAQPQSQPQAQQTSRRGSDTLGADDHYLAVHLGGFLSSDSYKWGGTDHVSNPGRLQGGVTYRIGELGRLADWAIRGDFIGYQFPEGNAVNFSVLPMVMFPDAGSAFPLYFGVGIGPGVFFQQIGNESTLSLNYELVGGVRFFDVVGNTGFFMETGLKNEVHLLSDGQFNGVFLSLGALFVF